MAGVLLPGPATVRSIRLLVATEACGYITVAFLMLAALAGGLRAWVATAVALLATLIAVLLTARARRAASGPEVGPDYDAEGWRPPWAQVYERPTHIVARSALFLFGIFSLTSAAGALWVDSRTWSVPAAYAGTALLALAVLIATRASARHGDEEEPDPETAEPESSTHG
jgi:hypothetical protein